MGNSTREVSMSGHNYLAIIADPGAIVCKGKQLIARETSVLTSIKIDGVERIKPKANIEPFNYTGATLFAGDVIRCKDKETITGFTFTSGSFGLTMD